jgi:hypothetical protein
MSSRTCGWGRVRFIGIFLAAAVWAGGAAGCRPAEKVPPVDPLSEPRPNSLTAGERGAGWILLFNGKTLDGWRGLGREGVPAGHWVVEDGCIHKIADENVPLLEDGQPLEGGDLMTDGAWLDFELVFEWKISRAGNSGVKYNVSEEMSIAVPPKFAALGFEYQVLDDEGHPDARNGADRTAAALYDLVPPQGKVLRPVGEFNRGRIVFRDGHGEHWLNGFKVLEYDLGSPDMLRCLDSSKYRDFPGFAERRRGHIVLQDHTDAVWFRSIKLRAPAGHGIKDTAGPAGP